MRRLLFPFLFLLAFVLVLPTLVVAGEFPYRGHWSNGRGETLVITDDTLRFAKGRAVPYRDVTRATDGHRFELQITARGAVNGFSGKFLSVSCRRDQMKIVSFATHEDLFQDTGSLDEVTWDRDPDDGDENDDE